MNSENVPTGLFGYVTAKLLARIFAGVLDLQPQRDSETDATYEHPHLY